ncbi:CrcB family protein [Frankia sp. R43]|uniref:FluC/FEX family fluoride channel n=1 Tax=Frankia sp. R43 TaxID=269536 RepID=UPI000AF0C056|nr:CrcB family protein [Frankia sp. R43]
MPSPSHPRPVDPDVDLSDPGERAELRPAPWPVLGAIAVGGALGALARHGLAVAFPHEPGDFDGATLAINTSGCFLIGVLMELVATVWAGRRLVRPFLGVGVLGGYTTFSTYVVDVQQSVDAGAVDTALVFLAVSVVAALAAVAAGSALAERALRRHAPTDPDPDPVAGPDLGADLGVVANPGLVADVGPDLSPALSADTHADAGGVARDGDGCGSGGGAR